VSSKAASGGEGGPANLDAQLTVAPGDGKAASPAVVAGDGKAASPAVVAGDGKAASPAVGGAWIGGGGGARRLLPPPPRNASTGASALHDVSWISVKSVELDRSHSA
jgi:hypothetical protein